MQKLQISQKQIACCSLNLTISSSRTREPKSNHEKGSSEPMEVRNKPEITQYASDKKKTGLET
jgi:hypothetical protein